MRGCGGAPKCMDLAARYSPLTGELSELEYAARKFVEVRTTVAT
jgi:hypothetical protein